MFLTSLRRSSKEAVCWLREHRSVKQCIQFPLIGFQFADRCPFLSFAAMHRSCDLEISLNHMSCVRGISDASPSTSVVPGEAYHRMDKVKTAMFSSRKSNLHGSFNHARRSDIQQAMICRFEHYSILPTILPKVLCGATVLMLSQKRMTICTGVTEDRKTDEESVKLKLKKEERNSSPGDSQAIGQKTMNAALEGGVRYSVIRINSTGTWEPLVLSSSELGVHPRDMDVLVSSNSFIPQRSTITLRTHKVLIRMENVRAIVYKDHCILFDAHRPRKTIFRATPTVNNVFKSQLLDAEATQKAREAFANSMAECARETPPSHLLPMPFHLRMLECLLEETCSFFRQKVERLKVVSDRMLEELTTDVNMGGLQRLLPLKRILTEVEHDIRDTHDAMEQVLDSDDMLQALCLERPTKSSWMEINSSMDSGLHQQSTLRQAAGDMLFSYLREVDDAGGVLEEMRKNMDAAQEVWELGLDTTRNRIMRSNLYISITTLSFSAATLPASYFGMNLTNGLEDHHKMFYYVASATSTSALILGAGLLFTLRVWPAVADKRRAEDLAALRDLLDHIDDVDEIFQNVSNQVAGGSISWEEFKQILKSHSSARFLREKEVELMFQMFDVNRNGLLEAEEWNTVLQRRSKDRYSAR
ncbi:hypothetical protein O6H91_14G068800 [Diphasiastrum complanatum]|uniref:Uncharacterized protein n=1 Tax=Diphasiastrum complanatum TaxID=34168 RepID=A0ACC2BR69_DIPCM|nr:hypothetical protein O6H91_14G068800 [Diphasiastrum complanatum]